MVCVCVMFLLLLVNGVCDVPAVVSEWCVCDVPAVVSE